MEKKKQNQLLRLRMSQFRLQENQDVCRQNYTGVNKKWKAKKKCPKPLTCIIRGLINKFANKSLEYNR